MWDDDNHTDGAPDDIIGRVILPLQPLLGAGPVTITTNLHDPAHNAFDVNYIEPDTSAYHCVWGWWLGG